MIESIGKTVKISRTVCDFTGKKKEDAAFLYQLLEGYEGLTNYSTITEDKNLSFRDIQLHLPEDQEKELLIVLDGIKKEIPLEVLSD